MKYLQMAGEPGIPIEQWLDYVEEVIQSKVQQRKLLRMSLLDEIPIKELKSEFRLALGFKDNNCLRRVRKWETLKIGKN